MVAIGRYIGEGFDDPRLDTLFLALPVSWKGTLVQYTGRLHRLHPGKRDIRIFDYVDREVPMLLRMFEKRLRGYRAIGYARGRRHSGTPSPRTKQRSSTTRTCLPNSIETMTLHENRSHATEKSWLREPPIVDQILVDAHRVAAEPHLRFDPRPMRFARRLGLGGRRSRWPGWRSLGGHRGM